MLNNKDLGRIAKLTQSTMRVEGKKIEVEIGKKLDEKLTPIEKGIKAVQKDVRKIRQDLTKTIIGHNLEVKSAIVPVFCALLPRRFCRQIHR